MNIKKLVVLLLAIGLFFNACSDMYYIDKVNHLQFEVYELQNRINNLDIRFSIRDLLQTADSVKTLATTLEAE